MYPLDAGLVKQGGKISVLGLRRFGPLTLTLPRAVVTVVSEPSGTFMKKLKSVNGRLPVDNLRPP